MYEIRANYEKGLKKFKIASYVFVVLLLANAIRMSLAIRGLLWIAIIVCFVVLCNFYLKMTGQTLEFGKKK
jgi:hypothetical protein